MERVLHLVAFYDSRCRNAVDAQSMDDRRATYGLETNRRSIPLAFLLDKDYCNTERRWSSYRESFRNRVCMVRNEPR